jgi:hypothetical protein
MTVTAWLLIGLLVTALLLVAWAAAEAGAPPHIERRARPPQYMPAHSVRPRPCECAYHLSE